MFAPIALDLTRLACGPVRHAPRGIDRVELAYARHFLNNWPGECFPVLPMPWGVRCFTRAQALDGVAVLERLWRESIDPQQDPAYQRALTFLKGNANAAPGSQPNLNLTKLEQARGFTGLLAATGLSFGRSVVRNLPANAIYLNVGQLEVFRPFLSWLGRRPDISSVFMIHDLIPLEFPEHHLPIGIKFHNLIVKNTAEFAKALIVPTRSVSASVSRELRKHGRDNVPIHVELLPVPSEFLEPAIQAQDIVRANYFIVCGAIDSYKNHMLLLKIWPDLVARLGSGAPKLVIAGSAGITSQPVIDWMEKTPSIGNHVILSPGLATQSLRRLIAGARALLMPSLAEGFGLPIVEALAQGTPVIASDIPVHREAGAGGDVIYLPSTNSAQWQARIESFSREPNADRASRRYNPKTWADYFPGIEAYLSDLPQLSR